LSSTGLSPCIIHLSRCVQLGVLILFPQPYNPSLLQLGLGSSPFARRYTGNLFDFFSSAY
ncbi:hypothetical protein, partial [Chlamydia suis]|uniref:hypothetical protein n=1 Tax=Chlamydia suis TaxID=83559 RepID=UPI001CA5EFD1